MKVALRVVGLTLAASFVILLGTGLWLIWHYRPTEAAGWANVQHISGIEWDTRVRGVHRICGNLTALTGLAFGVLIAIDAVRTRRWWSLPRGALTAIAIPVAAFSGFLIAWDQLALWAVTVGSSMSGYGPIFTDKIRYALVGHAEISASTLRLWFWTHTVVLPLVFIGLVGIALRRDWRPAIGSPAEPDVDVTRSEPWHSPS